MQCPSCRNENAPEAKFCSECGAPLTGLAAAWRPRLDLQTQFATIQHTLPAVTRAVENDLAAARAELDRALALAGSSATPKAGRA